MKVGGFRLATTMAASVLALSLGACGGGGGGASAPTATLFPGGSATAAPAPAGTGALSFTILVPSSTLTSAGARTPKFTAPSTASVAVTLAGGSTPLTTANLTPGSPGCTATSAGTSCTVTTSAPAGNDTFVITTYDGANATGHLLSNTRVPATISANATNRVPLALNGAVNAVTVLLGASSVPVGAPAQVAVTVVAYDVNGNIIVGAGNFSPAVTLTDSDNSGTTSLSATSVTAPGTSVTLNYNGNSLAGATITPSLSGAGGTMTAATFAPAGTAVVNYPFPSTLMTVDAMTRGPGDGNVWFAAEDNGGPSINVIGPSGGITSFTNGIVANEIYALSASGSLVWFGDNFGNVGSITTGGTATYATNFTTPCQSSTFVCGTVGYMTTAPDGTVWFSDNNDGYNYIGTITAGGTVTEYDVATANNLACFRPQQISVSADGTALYVTDFCDTVDRIAISGDAPGTATQVGVPCDTEAATVGPDGNAWFTDDCGNVGMIPSTNFTQTAELTWNIAPLLPSGYALTNMIASPGGLWFSDDKDNIVWEATGLGSVSASQPPAVIAIPAFTSANLADPFALAVGGDGNIWTATMSCSTPAAAKILYGSTSTTIGTLSTRRMTASVSHTKLKVNRPHFNRGTKKA